MIILTITGYILAGTATYWVIWRSGLACDHDTDSEFVALLASMFWPVSLLLGGTVATLLAVVFALRFIDDHLLVYVKKHAIRKYDESQSR